MVDYDDRIARVAAQDALAFAVALPLGEDPCDDTAEDQSQQNAKASTP
jgi:hypothetical protein